MSKNFEEEYKEYLNAQAPDLWDRIEEGVDARIAAGEQNVVSIKKGSRKRVQKKKQIRYQHYRTIVSVAACLFALLLVVPVYLLVKPAGKNGEAAADSAAPIVLTDATIENIEVPAEESAEMIEESAPEETVATETTEAGANVDELMVADGATDLAQNLPEEKAEETQGTDLTGLATAVETEEPLILPEEATEEAVEEETAQEEAEETVAAEEDMEVSILSEGVLQENGMIYAAVVAGSISSSPIVLVVPPEVSLTFEKDKRYIVTVSQSADGSYIVVSATLVE